MRFDRKRLETFNKHTFNLDSNYACFDFEDRYSENLLMGLFYGNKILFIGRNPGFPKVISNSINQFHVQEMNYARVQELYSLQFSSWRLSKYILNMCDHMHVDFYKSCSFTNLVKYATVDNKQHGIREKIIFSKILERQISLLKPDIIVTMSSATREVVSALLLKDVLIIDINHPSYRNYSSIQCKLDAAAVLAAVNDGYC